MGGKSLALLFESDKMSFNSVFVRFFSLLITSKRGEKMLIITVIIKPQVIVR